MKKVIISSVMALSLAATLVPVTMTPADALVVRVGPRGGVGVGFGRPGWRGRGFYGHRRGGYWRGGRWRRY